MKFLLILWLPAIFSVSISQTKYYVDAENGSDSWWTSTEKQPYKTLEHALYKSTGNAAIIYLREGQIFSDLTSQVVKVSSNLTIKCWTNDLSSSCVTILFNQPNISFAVASADMRFEGIRFNKPRNNPTATLIDMSSSSALLLQNVEFSGYSLDGAITLISSGASNSSVIMTNTSFSGLDFKAASILTLYNGKLSLDNFTVGNCTFNGSAAFSLNGDFSFDLRNSKFEANALYGYPLFSLSTIPSTKELFKIDSVHVKNNYGRPLQQDEPMAIFLSLNSQESEVILSNSVFENNAVINGTSGVRVYGKRFEALNCSFSNNNDSYAQKKFNHKGTGVLTIYASNAVITNSRFTSNTHTYGGAIFFRGNTSLTISKSNFSANRAANGGSVYVHPLSAKQMDISIVDSQFVRNAANVVSLDSFVAEKVLGYGGALHFNLTGSTDQINCFVSRNDFVKNQAGSDAEEYLLDGFGGAIYFNSIGNVTFINNSLEENKALKWGGGLHYEEGTHFYSEGNTFKGNNVRFTFALGGGGGAIFQSRNYTDRDSFYTSNQATRGGALYIMGGMYAFDNVTFYGNFATKKSGCLEAWADKLTISGSNFSHCWSDWNAGALFFSGVSGERSVFERTVFESNEAAESIIEISETNFFSWNIIIRECNFSHNTAEKSLIKSYNSEIAIRESNFVNTTGTILEQIRGVGPQFNNNSVINTSCKRSGSGCLVDATGVVHLNMATLNVVGMRMPADNSAIVVRSLQSLFLSNSIFANISGPRTGACVSALDSTNITIRNFSVKNFESGCLFYDNVTNVDTGQFFAENTVDNMKSNVDSQDASAIYMNGVVVGASLTKIEIKGNKKPLKTNGGAMHLSNCRAISLENASFEDNLAESGGALFIKNSTVSMKNVVFFRNAAIRGGGLYVEKSLGPNRGRLELLNLSFTENVAQLMGGGAHFEEIDNFTLKNITFQSNRGLERKSSSVANSSRGGAIYYSCEKKNGACNAQIEGELVFINNSADVGGAFYFNKRLFYPTNGSIFDNNSAARYGPTFASSPVQIVHGEEMENVPNLSVKIFKNGAAMSRDEFIGEYFIDPNNLTDNTQWNRFIDTAGNTLPNLTLEIKYYNQTGGSPLQQPLSFYAIDYFGQKIVVDNETYYIKVQQSSTLPSKKNNFTEYSVNGSFIFTGSFTSYPGESIPLALQTTIECLLFSSSNIIVNIGIRKCYIGEILPQSSEICSLCPPKSFSLAQVENSSDICQSCQNVTGLMCEKGGKDLTVGPEYWRFNESSLNVIRCPNPAACTPGIPNTASCSSTYSLLKPSNLAQTCKSLSHLSDIQRDYSACAGDTLKAIEEYCLKIRNGTTTGVCSQGYEGDLCAQCKYGWGKSKTYECVECKLTVWFFVQMVGVGLIKLGLIVYTVYKAQNICFQDKMHSIMLRILITFFQTESLLFEVPMHWPPFFDGVRNFIISLFTNGGNPGDYSYDCLSDWIGTRPSLSYFESNALYSFLAPLLFTLAAGLLLLGMRFIGKRPLTWQYARDLLIVTCLVTYFYFWPAIVTAAFKTLRCIDVGPKGANEWKLLSDPNLSCFVGRHWVLLFFGIATLVLSGVVLPALFLGKLWRNKNSLEDESFMKKYSFFYCGYSEKYYLWEFLVLIRKMALVGASVFLARSLSNMCITLAVIIVISAGLQLRFSPFKDEKLNRLELIALLCLTAMSFGCQYHINLANYSSTMIFVTLAIASTIVFLLPWIRVYAGILWNKVEPFYQCFKSFAKKYWVCFRGAVEACLKKICRSQPAHSRSITVTSIEINEETHPESVLDLQQEKKKLLGDEKFIHSSSSSIAEPLLNKEIIIHSKIY